MMRLGGSMFVSVRTFLLCMGTLGVLSTAGCTKRCRPGLTLSGDKCVSSSTGAMLSDGGTIDASDAESLADAEVGASGEAAESVRDAGRAGEGGAPSPKAMPNAAGSGGSGPALAGAGAPSNSGAVCGDGIVQGQELCDPASAAVPCPTSCADANPCTEDVLSGSSADCTAQCKFNTITKAAPGDDCCPAGATPETDADCAAECTSTNEVCDGRDNDCDDRVDEDALNACGGCGALQHEPRAACSDGSGACEQSGAYVCMGLDAVACNATARAPSDENCDGEDNDCDGSIDEDAGTTWYQDCDSDGYAAVGDGRDACAKPADTNGCGWTDRTPTASATDCDDQNAARHPGAEFGLPITRTGQALPPPNDPAYDLDCDGVLTRGGTGFATGQIVQGELQLLDLCPETFMCTGGGPYCVQSFAIPGGGAICGQPYRTFAPCTGDIDVYFPCR
jgi:hypothetical protein